MPEFPTDYGPRIELDDPDVKAVAQYLLDEVKLGVLKGVAHELDPQTYPVGNGAPSIETATIEYIRRQPPETQESAKAAVRALVGQSAAERANMYGRLAQVDLRSGLTVAQQAEQLGLDRDARLERRKLSSLRVAGNRVVAGPERSDPARTAVPSDNGVRNRPSVVRPGAWRGPDPIAKKYQELGGASGELGPPDGGRGVCPDGKGRYQHYKRGSIYWSPETGAQMVCGAIRDKWRSLGWENSLLGYPTTDELTTPDKHGRFNHFQGGSIYWTPETGAHEIHGAIGTKWRELDFEKGFLGYPTSDETATPDTIGRFNHFQGGSIYWTPETGACAVHKNIRDRWESLGWELGYLGYPVQDTTFAGLHGSTVVMSCRFQGGSISYNPMSGATDSTPLTRLRLRIHQVNCIDETNPEGGDGDEIAMGGVASSINSGQCWKVDEFGVGGGFRDGTQLPISPPREFCVFNLKDIPGWPKHFDVAVALAEKDEGGFGDFLKELLKWIRDAVTGALAEHTAGLVGSALGALIGALGGAIGSIVGAVVGWVVGELFDWLISLFEDDPFPPFTVPLALPSVWHRWGEYSNSPMEWFWTRAHGGEYHVWYDWELLP